MSDKLRWGIIGTADIAQEVVRGIQTSNTSELVAIASRSAEKAAAFAKHYNVPKQFDSYEALLNSGQVDLIYLPLPNSLHAKWTIRALETGHHVLCEKPITADAQEAMKVAEAAKEADRLVAEAFMYRFHPQWATVQNIIADGGIGELSSMQAEFTFLLDEPEANPFSAELAGGALRDVGCYCVNAFRMIAGCEPVKVSALARFGNVDETMVGLLEFKNGLFAHFETSLTNYERHQVEIAGTEGYILMASPWIPGDENAPILIERGEEQEELYVEAADSYKMEVEDFVAAAKGATPLKWPIADSIANMKVIDALLLSAKENRAVILE